MGIRNGTRGHTTYTPLPLTFFVSRGNKGLTGEIRVSRGNKGLSNTLREIGSGQEGVRGEKQFTATSRQLTRNPACRVQRPALEKG